MLVKPGDTLAAEDPLIVLESDKASLEVPAPQAGTVREVRVKVGDKVSQGDLILSLEVAMPAAAPAPTADAGSVSAPRPPAQTGSVSAPRPAAGNAAGSRSLISVANCWCWAPGQAATQPVRAADLGLKTVLVERYPTSVASA